MCINMMEEEEVKEEEKEEEEEEIRWEGQVEALYFRAKLRY